MAQEVDEVRGVFLSWVIANVLGFGVLGALHLFLSPQITGLLLPALVVGVPVGLAQWIAVRRLAQVSIAWVLSISTGLLIAFVILRVIPDGLWGIAFASFGLLVGTLQWSLLRGHFSRAIVWVLASAVGIAIPFWLVLSTGLTDQSGLISAIVMVLAYSSITGLGLNGCADSTLIISVVYATPPNNSLERTGDAAAEASDNEDAGFCKTS